MKGFTVFAPPPLPSGETEARERNSLTSVSPYGGGYGYNKAKNLAYWDFSGLFKINVDKN